MARTLSLTALAVLAEGKLISTTTGLRGISGRCYAKRVTDPLFRQGLLTTTFMHAFTQGVRCTAEGVKALHESRQAALGAEIARQNAQGEALAAKLEAGA